MKEDIKARWLEALRGGQYIQGQNNLRNADDTYCCLGVLCEIAKADGVVELNPVPLNYDGKERMEFYYRNPEDTEDTDALGLPEVVQKWAGLDSSNPTVGSERLANLNDKGVPFLELAERIEATL